jgi:hypothetical protein
LDGNKGGRLTPDLQGTSSQQHKEQAGPADWGFVAFVIIITAIALTLTLIQIYLQNPK